MSVKWSHRGLTGLLIGALGLGCGDDTPTPAADDGSTGTPEGSTQADESSGSATPSGGGTDDTVDPEAEPTPLEPAKLLVRISTALRGKRPSLPDLDLVEDDPDALPEIVDRYLDSEEFGEVIRDLHNDALLMDTEVFDLDALEPLQAENPSAIAESVFATSLRMAEHIVREERPYTELVTADYWVVDARAAAVWGTDYDASGPTWQQVPVPDDRPTAGILTDNAFYMRHESCGFNFNRGRANKLSNALLCHDFLDSAIDVDGTVDLSDPDAVASAVNSVAACMGCHQTLDPMATALNGFLEMYIPDSGTYAYPLQTRHQNDYVDLWPDINGRPPGFFGHPIDGPGELGERIAADPRFSLCAAMRFYSYFAQVPLDDVPIEVASDLQIAFEDSDFNAKTLVREIMLSDDFAIASAGEAGDADTTIGYKRARPFQLSNLIAQLTGYEWRLDLDVIGDGPGEISLARNGLLGFEVLAGGHDSFFTTTADLTVNATTALFMRKLATDAASFAVERDFAVDVSNRRLFGFVEPGESGEDAVREQIVWLHRRLYGEAVASDDASVDDAYAVFAGVYERSGEAETAWKATLSAMLQDLHIVYY